jgi:hypothetical protein
MERKTKYPKGNAMTFPLELTQIEEEKEIGDLKYLYPLEISSLNEKVMTVCDQMEYDGSMMYDKYPDKVTMGRIADSICCQEKMMREGELAGEKWIKPLVEVMLCNEMSCRREKRCRHKKRIAGGKSC